MSANILHLFNESNWFFFIFWGGNVGHLLENGKNELQMKDEK